METEGQRTTQTLPERLTYPPLTSKQGLATGLSPLQGSVTPPGLNHLERAHVFHATFPPDFEERKAEFVRRASAYVTVEDGPKQRRLPTTCTMDPLPFSHVSQLQSLVGNARPSPLVTFAEDEPPTHVFDTPSPGSACHKRPRSTRTAKARLLSPVPRFSLHPGLNFIGPQVAVRSGTKDGK